MHQKSGSALMGITHLLLLLVPARHAAARGKVGSGDVTQETTEADAKGATGLRNCVANELYAAENARDINRPKNFLTIVRT